MTRVRNNRWHCHTVSAPLKRFKHMKDIGICGSEPNEAVNK